jgi:hypothetical protein
VVSGVVVQEARERRARRGRRGFMLMGQRFNRCLLKRGEEGRRQVRTSGSSP